MAVEIIFPRVDMDMSSGRVSRWLVEEGSAVGKGDPLFEIETDKAAMEIDAPASGVLRGIRSADGQQVPVGAGLGWIVADGEAWPEIAVADGALPASAASGAALPTESDATAPGSPDPHPGAAPLRATPLARREAKRRKIDLGDVQGSGPRGRIIVGDLPGVVPPSPAAAGERRPTGSQARPAGRASDAVYRRWLGLAHGTPVVFLHGFGSDQTSWRSVWGSLEATHRILAIDLPGHGRSQATGQASFDALIDTVQAVLDEERLSRLHLVGHSLGGAIALGLVEAGASDIRSLCLIAPVGLGAEIDGAFLCGLTRSEREDSLAPWLRRLFADPDIVTPAFVKATLRSRTADSKAFQDALRHAVFADGTQTVALRHVLKRITMPTKVIWGRRDSIIPATHARQLPGAVALHTVCCGHMPQLEEARLVAALISEVTRSASGEEGNQPLEASSG